MSAQTPNSQELKRQLIQAYFARWRDDLTNVRALLDDQRYRLEVILILSCYIDALGTLRYPRRTGNKAYKSIVKQYSGRRQDFEMIDLLFFYQWPRSDFRDLKIYKELEHYERILEILVATFGSEDQIRDPARTYRNPNDIIAAVLANPFQAFNRQNLQRKLSLFSIAEILYRIVRCYAVHAKSFPLVQSYVDAHGRSGVRENHFITAELLYTVTSNIIERYESECLAEGDWPHAFRS